MVALPVGDFTQINIIGEFECHADAFVAGVDGVSEVFEFSGSANHIAAVFDSESVVADLAIADHRNFRRAVDAVSAVAVSGCAGKFNAAY